MLTALAHYGDRGLECGWLDLQTGNCHRDNFQLRSLSPLFPTSCLSMACTLELSALKRPSSVCFPAISNIHAPISILSSFIFILSYSIHFYPIQSASPPAHISKKKTDPFDPTGRPTAWLRYPTPTSVQGRATCRPASPGRSADHPPDTPLPRARDSSSQPKDQITTREAQTHKNSHDGLP